MKGRLSGDFKRILADAEARNKLLRAVSRGDSSETITVKENTENKSTKNKNTQDNSQITYKVTISESINLPKSEKSDLDSESGNTMVAGATE